MLHFFHADIEYLKIKIKIKLELPKMSMKMFTYENISFYERTYFYIHGCFLCFFFFPYLDSQK